MPSAASARTASTVAASSYRPEIQGLRALAVVLVVIYHVWINRISGGVDVFLLVSGFLITGQLYRATAGSGIDLAHTWSRIVKRLFPAVLVVLIGIVAFSALLLPETRWNVTIRQIFAAAVYLENWQLIADQTDYFTDSGSASVVQHFWSLSLQGQFYLVWPLFVAAIALVARRLRFSLTTALVLSLSSTFVVSLIFSILLTLRDQPTAYFHSLTRVWEFALGGLLALVIDRIRLPVATRVWLGWLGVLGLVACGAVLSVGQLFPGYAALWPTLCAVAIIIGGSTGHRLAADRALSSAAADYLGRLSFSLYLWHWPILVLFLTMQGRPEAGPGGGALVIGIAVLLSILTLHLVEDPVRTSRRTQLTPWRIHGAAAVALVMVLAIIGSFSAVSAEKGSFQVTAEDADHPGAAATLPGFSYAGAPSPGIVPPLVALPGDFASAPKQVCRSSRHLDFLIVCSTTAAEPAKRTIAIVGDSHTQQYIAGLVPIAEKRHWNLVMMLRGACPFTAESELADETDREACEQWNRASVLELADIQPDAVLTVGTRDVGSELTERVPDGYVGQWREMQDLGIPVLAVRDNPRFDESPANCVERRGVGPACTASRSDLYTETAPILQRGDIPDNVVFLDFSDLICTQDICPAEIGNVFVYLDNNHLSATYVTTMSPMIERAILERMGW